MPIAQDTQEERHTIQLAAISTASIQNTRGTIVDRIDRNSPYWTVAYEDVCRAIDREIKQRERADRLDAALRLACNALAEPRPPEGE